MKFSLCAVVALLFVASSVNGFVFLSIDTFSEFQLPLVFTVGPGAAPYDWYTIYTGDANYAGAPAFVFQDTTDCLGGQRDIFLGHEGVTPIGSTSVISIVTQKMSIAFPLNYVGGAYFQWDGDDAAGGASAFPGAILSSSPGIGSGISAGIPESNGQSIDFTSFGNALGIRITISADHEVAYFLDLVDSFGNFNEFDFIHDPLGEDTEITYFFRYDDPGWSNLSFDFTDVAGFQVKVFTFDDGQTANAIDTDFFNLLVLGYEVTGNVFLDCGCIGVPDSFVLAERVNLFSASAPSTVIDFTTTDINGNFVFTGLDDGNYIACLDNLAQDLCTPFDGCLSFTLANQIDPAPLSFSISEISGLTPPPDATVECGGCTTTACLGAAIATVCGGGSAPVTTFTDGPISGGCTQTFVRTFSDQGNFASQTITIVDTTNPIVSVPASNEARACDDNLALSYNAWLAADGNAVFSDCSAFSVGNNAGLSDPCGSVTVTFTATDICGLTATSTGSYAIIDNTPPVFNQDPSNASAPCDEAGNSDFSAFNAWLATNGGASASDACGSTIITNNFVQGSLDRGCSESVVVTYTATDSCGNFDSRSASFTIQDLTGPTIAPQASNQSAQCNSNTSVTFNAWLSDNGGARATDDCGSASVTFTNDFFGSSPFGCGASATVVFTATDDCFQSASTSATFNVVDTVSPVLDTPASDFNSDCANQGNDLNNWLNDAGGARATDACDGAIFFTNNFNSLPSTDCGGTPVLFTGCDTCGNCVTSQASFSIIDNESPVFIIPPTGLSVECSTDVQTTYDAWVASVGGSTFSDNCALSSELGVVDTAPANAPVLTGNQCTATNTVLFRVADPCGNLSEAVSADFTVTDSNAPNFTAFPLDQTEQCGSGNSAAYTSWRNSQAGATATDACSSVIFSNDGPQSFSLTTGDCIDSVFVTFTASDPCGNAVSAAATFTIVDNTAPVFSQQAVDETSECNSVAFEGWLSDNGRASASDVCTGVTFTNNFFAFSGGCVETAFVTFTATDACGNAADTSATYSISDNTAPGIFPQASSITVPCDQNTGSELSNWLNTQGGADASDACQDDADLIWTNDFTSSVVSCDFVDVTFTVTDACGNFATTSARFTSSDTDAPTFSPEASNTVVECNGSGNVDDYNLFVQSRAGSVPIDQCALSFTFSNNAPQTGPTTCGSQNVVFTVEDECGNAASTSATFTVQDSFAPAFTTLPSSISVECDGAGNQSDRNQWVSSNGGAVAVDTCATSITYSQTLIDSQGDECSAIDVYQFTAFDNCGNSDFVTASFTIHDFTAPTISVEPTDASYECDGNGNLAQITSWVNDNAGARGSDICQGAVVFTNNFNGLGLFTCVSSTVTFTATDGCGNTVARSATVSVTDTTNPIFSFFPDDITIPCDADSSTDALGFATASDVCAGDLFVSFVETSFDEPPTGDCPGDHIITRTFSATDDCGNSITRDQVVTVVIARASGPCDPVGCECDDCCPPAAASDCIAVDCQAASCTSTPCEASLCSCELQGSSKSATVERRVGDELPQCKPVYIYVNDDDDTEREEDAVARPPRMLVSNEALHI